jgi:protein TonB
MAMTSDLVSSTIAARSREPEGLRKMMAASAIAHGVAIVALVVGPYLFGTHQPRETIMEVSFNSPGAQGFESGGMTALSARAVQKAEPKPELPKPTPVRPPAAKTPEMVEPIAKPTPPKPTQRQASTATKVAPPSTGETVRPGQSKVETGSTSNEGGLSTSSAGGATNQGQINFCDPQYLGQMVSLIYNNWRRDTAVAAKPIIRFVIQRDGVLRDITVRQSSGYYALDNAAQRAVILTRAIPPLPACYPYPDFAMNLTFEYIR